MTASALDNSVPAGRTGVVTNTTAYGVLCAGTTATGAQQNAGAGTAGQVLTSNGAAALPSFQDAVSQIKFWVRMYYNAGVPTARSSLNLSSITDNTTGDFTLNFTTNFASADSYAVTTSVGGATGVANTIFTFSQNSAGNIAAVAAAAGSLRCVTTAGAIADITNEIGIACMGTQ